eukprot:197574_1
MHGTDIDSESTRMLSLSYAHKGLQMRRTPWYRTKPYQILMCCVPCTLVFIIAVYAFSNQESNLIEEGFTTSIPSIKHNHSSGGDDHDKCQVMFIADLHIEPFFSETMTHNGKCRIAHCSQKTKHCTPNLDPELNWSFPRVGCDPPPSLLESALKYANESLAKPCAVIVGGDLIAHSLNIDNDLANTIQRYVLKRIKTYFPHSAILFLIGNNDLLEDGVLSVEDFSRLWGVMIESLVPSDNPLRTPMPLNELCQVSVDSDFLEGGYYDVSLSERCSTPLRAVLLNTQMMKTNAGHFGKKSNRNSETKSLAAKQLKWFESKLRAAKKKGEMVIVAGHIPPGVFFGKTDWQPWAQKRYIEICDAYESTIVAQVFGHHSKEMIRSLSPHTGLFITIGMTPVGGHTTIPHYSKKKKAQSYRDPVNPGFASLTIDKVKKQMFYESHFVNIQMLSSVNRTTKEDLESGWETLSCFETTYNVPDSSASSIHKASKTIMTNPTHGVMYKAILRGFMSTLPLHQIMCDASVSTLNKETECLQSRCMFDASRGCSPWNSDTRN